jgi:hypothetical protein
VTIDAATLLFAQFSIVRSPSLLAIESVINITVSSWPR